VFASNKPITKPADVSGLKLRLPGMTTYVEAWGGLNVISTSVSMGELYTALQTGVAEACEGGYEQMATLKMNEVQKYIAETNHVYEHVGLYISKSLFESMSENQQKIITSCALESMAYADDLALKTRENYKKRCLDGGMTLVNLDRQMFVDALAEFHKDQFKTKWAGISYAQVRDY
jgi:TRAP-type C4-dicarboxylate transport system substrate-binding protein